MGKILLRLQERLIRMFCWTLMIDIVQDGNTDNTLKLSLRTITTKNFGH
jgi:hypothetical protein